MTPIEALATLRDLLAADATGQDALDVIEVHMRTTDALIRVMRRDPAAIHAAACAIADEGLAIGAVSDAVGKAGRS